MVPLSCTMQMAPKPVFPLMASWLKPSVLKISRAEGAPGAIRHAQAQRLETRHPSGDQAITAVEG